MITIAKVEQYPIQQHSEYYYECRVPFIKLTEFAHKTAMSAVSPIRGGAVQNCRGPQLLITASQTCFAVCTLLNW